MAGAVPALQAVLQFQPLLDSLHTGDVFVLALSFQVSGPNNILKAKYHSNPNQNEKLETYI